MLWIWIASDSPTIFGRRVRLAPHENHFWPDLPVLTVDDCTLPLTVPVDSLGGGGGVVRNVRGGYWEGPVIGPLYPPAVPVLLCTLP